MTCQVGEDWLLPGVNYGRRSGVHESSTNMVGVVDTALHWNLHNFIGGAVLIDVQNASSCFYTTPRLFRLHPANVSEKNAADTWENPIEDGIAVGARAPRVHH